MSHAHELACSSTSAHTQWLPHFEPGPYWPSFERFRTSGTSSLEVIAPGTVGTLRCKKSTYRILVDSDFQKLLGLAAEVHRLKQGITVVFQAAKVVAKHNDKESIELLVQTASMLNASNLLPERDGHGEFEIDESEKAAFGEAESEIRAADVPRPVLA